MKGFLTLVVSLIIGLSFGQAQPKIKADKVDPYLLRLIKDSPESYHKVYILLKDRVNILNLERNFKIKRKPLFLPELPSNNEFTDQSSLHSEAYSFKDPKRSRR